MHTNSLNGIEHHTIELRKNLFGDNKPFETETTTFIDCIKESIQDLTLLALLIVDFLYFFLGIIYNPFTGWIDGAIIFVSVDCIIFVTAIKYYITERKFNKFKKEILQKYIYVIRDSKAINIPVLDLVVGDIAKIEAGDVMTVDALVLLSSNLLVDQNSLTGESDPVKKERKQTDNADPFLLSGSRIINGNATIVVLAVGTNTFLSKSFADMEMQEEIRETPLQVKLNETAEYLGKFSLFMVLIIFIVLVIKGIMIFNIHEIIKSIYQCLDCLIITLVLVVIAIPEGLTIAARLNLAFSINKIKHKGNVIQHLEASETLGQVTSICSATTGILTKNTMSIVSISIGREIFEKSDIKSIHPQIIERLYEQICCNTSTSLSHMETHPVNSIEIALLKLGIE